jgi:hypothetical protein
MQDFYIKQSVNKALTLDMLEPGNQTSSCVDDVFFILKSSARRAFSAGEEQIFISTLSSMGLCLDHDYLNYLTTNLNQSSTNMENKEGRLQFIVYFYFMMNRFC